MRIFFLITLTLVFCLFGANIYAGKPTKEGDRRTRITMQPRTEGTVHSFGEAIHLCKVFKKTEVYTHWDTTVDGSRRMAWLPVKVGEKKVDKSLLTIRESKTKEGFYELDYNTIRKKRDFQESKILYSNMPMIQATKNGLNTELFGDDYYKHIIAEHNSLPESKKKWNGPTTGIVTAKGTELRFTTTFNYNIELCTIQNQHSSLKLKKQECPICQESYIIRNYWTIQNPPILGEGVLTKKGQMLPNGRLGLLVQDCYQPSYQPLEFLKGTKRYKEKEVKKNGIVKFKFKINPELIMPELEIKESHRNISSFLKQLIVYNNKLAQTLAPKKKYIDMELAEQEPSSTHDNLESKNPDVGIMEPEFRRIQQFTLKLSEQEQSFIAQSGVVLNTQTGLFDVLENKNKK